MDVKRIWELRAAIADAQERLNEVNDALKAMTPKVDGMPKPKSVDDRISRLVASKIELANQITELKLQLNVARADLMTEFATSTTLNAQERKVLRLRYIECKPFSQIARQMNFSENNVYLLHRRGLKKMSAS